MDIKQVIVPVSSSVGDKDESVAVSSLRGDVDMLARLMSGGWLQKAVLMPAEGDESGLGDSGAQISVTNVATAKKFGLKIQLYDKPVRLSFAQGAAVCVREFVSMGSVLGDVAVLEAETIFSLWSICENGYEVILDRDQIKVKDKSLGKIVYQAASDPENKEWRLGIEAMMSFEPSSGVSSSSDSALVRENNLLNRDHGHVGVKKASASKRGQPRITDRIKNSII